MNSKDMSVPEVISIMQELSLKLAQSRYGGEVDLMFLQRGKGIKVQLGQGGGRSSSYLDDES